MKNQLLSLLAGATLMLSACTDDVTNPVAVQSETEAAKADIVFSAEDFIPAGGQSRTAITPDAEGASFAWAQNDIIGILPDDGAQVYFTIKELSADARKATFSGGAWGLKSANDYTAYYPFIQDIMLNREAVPVDYSVQSYKYQTNTDGKVVVSPSHDYMAAKAVKAESGNLNFQFSHLGALVEVQFTLPEAAEVKRLYLTADGASFPVKGTFDLTAQTVAITPDNDNLAYTVTVNVENLKTTEANQTVSVFFMMPPMGGEGSDFNTNGLKATVVYGENNAACTYRITDDYTSLRAETYYTLQTETVENSSESFVVKSTVLSGFLLKAMYKYGGTKLRFVTGSPVVSDNSLYSSGVSARVVRNGDWLEVHTSARSIRFSDQSTSFMFDGNTYYPFTFLQEIDLRGVDFSDVVSMEEMFDNCTSLTSITFGDDVNTSAVTNMRSMFGVCPSLKSLDLSGFDTSNVTDMGLMFWYCSSLESLDISSFNTSKVTSMYYMFDQCSSLKTLDLGSFDTSGVTNMESMFRFCHVLTELDLSNFCFDNTLQCTSMFNDTGRDAAGKPISIYVTTAGKTYLENKPTGINKNYAKLDDGNPSDITYDGEY